MRRVLALILVAVTCILMAACSKTMNCEGCGLKRKCKEHTVEYLGFQKTLWLCDDCINNLDNLGNLLDEYIDK